MPFTHRCCDGNELTIGAPGQTIPMHEHQEFATTATTSDHKERLRLRELRTL